MALKVKELDTKQYVLSLQNPVLTYDELGEVSPKPQPVEGEEPPKAAAQAPTPIPYEYQLPVAPDSAFELDDRWREQVNAELAKPQPKPVSASILAPIFDRVMSTSFGKDLLSPVARTIKEDVEPALAKIMQAPSESFLGVVNAIRDRHQDTRSFKEKLEDPSWLSAISTPPEIKAEWLQYGVKDGKGNPEVLVAEASRFVDREFPEAQGLERVAAVLGTSVVGGLGWGSVLKAPQTVSAAWNSVRNAGTTFKKWQFMKGMRRSAPEGSFGSRPALGGPETAGTPPPASTASPAPTVPGGGGTGYDYSRSTVITPGGLHKSVPLSGKSVLSEAAPLEPVFTPQETSAMSFFRGSDGSTFGPMEAQIFANEFSHSLQSYGVVVPESVAASLQAMTEAPAQVIRPRVTPRVNPVADPVAANSGAPIPTVDPVTGGLDSASAPPKVGSESYISQPASPEWGETLGAVPPNTLLEEALFPANTRLGSQKVYDVLTAANPKWDADLAVPTIYRVRGGEGALAVADEPSGHAGTAAFEFYTSTGRDLPPGAMEFASRIEGADPQEVSRMLGVIGNSGLRKHTSGWGELRDRIVYDGKLSPYIESIIRDRLPGAMDLMVRDYVAYDKAMSLALEAVAESGGYSLRGAGYARAVSDLEGLTKARRAAMEIARTHPAGTPEHAWAVRSMEAINEKYGAPKGGARTAPTPDEVLGLISPDTPFEAAAVLDAPDIEMAFARAVNPNSSFTLERFAQLVAAKLPGAVQAGGGDDLAPLAEAAKRVYATARLWQQGGISDDLRGILLQKGLELSTGQISPAAYVGHLDSVIAATQKESAELELAVRNALKMAGDCL
ncbi:MAG: hypothetical protein BWK76_27805 [Desulfobulbaceae bacterium A2]|nr:MAG: hypothetical protein BWK76_27805 [Desulfobulbaceae bacterium A2]